MSQITFKTPPIHQTVTIPLPLERAATFDFRFQFPSGEYILGEEELMRLIQDNAELNELQIVPAIKEAYDRLQLLIKLHRE